MNKLKNSAEFYKRSQLVLAGPSTFGKGVDQFAYGITPYALEKGEGAYFWDVDGNKYIDTLMGLGALLLGYRHPKVDQSLQKQLSKGISFSLAHRLEVEIAELLCERIPCAEMVRFGKNGNDVTSAAVRLARYISGKNHVLFCGYHGWQDWYISQTSMDGGIPKEIKQYSHRFEYNNFDSFVELVEKYNKKLACIIMEPVSRLEPKHGFLNLVREYATKNDIILIFDEVVTGFRFHRGGYQTLSEVIPDLACFSKAMGNGVPISALVGKKDIMKHCPEIFFSLTFAGETLSLSAVKAVLEIIDEDNVPECIDTHGKQLMKGTNELINKYELQEIISIEGFPCRSGIIFKDSESVSAADIRTYWIQELILENIFTNGTHLISHVHNNKIINKILSAYDTVLNKIQHNLVKGSFQGKLKCPTSSENIRNL